MNKTQFDKRREVGSRSRMAVLRMALVVSGSFAVLAAMPGWLRSWESFPADSTQLADVVVAASVVPSETTPAAQKDVAHHQALAEALGKRYRVSRDALEGFIGLAYAAGQMTKIDPLLILAVMAVESSFNPVAESVMGAKGLMQIIPEYHQDKLVGPRGVVANVLDPEINILAGAKVLREYATRSGEDLAAALRLYGGTGPDPGNAYATRVLSERDRLQQVLRRTLQSGELRPVAGQRS